MKHLYANVCHDESEVWCGRERYYRDGEPTHRPDEADCPACLDAASTFGAAAAARLRSLVPAAADIVQLAKALELAQSGVIAPSTAIAILRGETEDSPLLVDGDGRVYLAESSIDDIVARLAQVLSEARR